MRRTSMTVGLVLASLIGSLLMTAPAGAAVPGLDFTETECQGDSDAVARLYTAAFGREPELGGFDFWMAEYTSGNRNLRQIAAFFVESPELVQRYGPLDDEAFVQQLYVNVLGRRADAAGADFWVGQLRDGLSRARLLMRFSESPENVERSGTTVPALGYFNEGRASGSWMCALPTIDEALLRSSDLGIGWSEVASSGGVDAHNDSEAPGSSCRSMLWVADAYRFRIFRNDDGTEEVQQVVHNFPTEVAARRFLERVRNTPEVCPIVDTGDGGTLDVFHLEAPLHGDETSGVRIRGVVAGGMYVSDVYVVRRGSRVSLVQHAEVNPVTISIARDVFAVAADRLG